MGHSSSKVRLVQQAARRGEPGSEEEWREWMNTKDFPFLPPRGQEAFFKFLREGDYGDEEKSILDFPVTSLRQNENCKKYQFFLRCQTLEVKSIFNDYILDEDTKISNAKGGIEEREEMANKAEEVDDYIKNLRESVKMDLDAFWPKFLESLKKEYKDRFEK